MTKPADSTPGSAASTNAAALSGVQSHASAVPPSMPQPPATTASVVQRSPGWLEPGTLSWEWAKAAPGALIPALVALAVGWVALNQYHVAKAKLNLDLFEKRLKLYELLSRLLRNRWDLINGVVVIDDDDVLAVCDRLEDYLFLFGADMHDFADNVVSHTFELCETQHDFMAARRESTEREALATKIASARHWREVQRSQLAERFQPYLDFSSWSARTRKPTSQASTPSERQHAE